MRRRQFLQTLAAAAAIPAFARPNQAADSTQSAAPPRANLSVDCSKRIGSIRPLHGGNCGPIADGGMVDLSTWHREIGIPSTRLHDCHWPNPDVVDIHVLFPNFNADPSRPESYDFARTDDYLRAILKIGSKIVYRLGESIEHTPRKYHVHPPADPARWAEICLGIIRHYNEGWADGFHHNIEHWEIWNEPENRPAMWTGSEAEFYRLYATASRAIKSKFPRLKVGGPSLGHSGDVVNGRFQPSPYLLAFLEHCRQNSAPLDFFSWHLYTDDPAECALRAASLRQTLDRSGFARAEMHFNEWNYLPDRDWKPMMLQGQGLPRQRFYERMGGPEGAAFAACTLITLQDTPIDVANYYRSDSGGFGLFSVHGVPHKVYYAFKAFRTLLDTPLRLAAAGAQPGRLGILVGVNADASAISILLSNYRAPEQSLELAIDSLPWQGPSPCQIFQVDGQHDFALARETTLMPPNRHLTLDLKGPSVCLVKLTRPTR